MVSIVGRAVKCFAFNLNRQSSVKPIYRTSLCLFSTFNQDGDWKNASSIYDFTAKDLDGNDVSLSKYKGFVTIIVNVASECGLTKSNYVQLNELNDKYSEAGLKIAAFPCNQFGSQEPGTCAIIKNFLKQHNVKFDVFGKIDVNGETAHPLYKYLKQAQHGFITDAIKWNFSKFLINKQGIPVKRYAPTDEPKTMEKDIEAELKK